MEIFGIHILDPEIILEALKITSIVFAMMVIIDWVDVRTRGQLQKWVSGRRFQQYFVSAFLGATPAAWVLI